jgi:alanine racemase
MLKNRLEPEIFSLRMLRNYISCIHTHTENQETREYAIHLKLDTGMSRLGFEKQDIEEIIRLLKESAASRKGNQHFSIKVKSILSHLAASEAPEHDDFTREQVGRFSKMYNTLSSGLGYKPLQHILNSAGIIRFPEHQMDMVRIGLGIYGIDNSNLIQHELATVNTLIATISQIRNLEKGETVGYNRAGIAEEPMRIATISLGYADGLLRKAGNRNHSVMIKGKRAPIVGRVCMDLTMVDVTKISEASEGDPVIIFGEDDEGNCIQAQELADAYESIPYEVFTSVSKRVVREYHR